MSHSHNHSHHNDHGHHDHVHDHDHDIEPALQTLLWKQIEFEKIVTLNESQRDSGAQIVEKTWPQRLRPEPVLVSDIDEQLLMTVPFAGTVRLHSILIRSSSASTAPKTLKVFLNRDDIDFNSAVDATPTQIFTLSQTSDVQDVPVKRALFGNTYSLSLFFEDNYGHDATEIYWIGFKGDFMKLNREPVHVEYEKAANPKDHVPIVGILDAASSGPRNGM